ncbi:DUF6585 family protein [Streptomyces sp. NPDC001494]
MTVFQEITERYANGIYVGTTYVYTLCRADGTTLKVTGFYDQPERWGPALQQEITRAQLPGLLAGLEQGGTLTYGELSATAGRARTPDHRSAVKGNTWRCSRRCGGFPAGVLLPAAPGGKERGTTASPPHTRPRAWTGA